MNYFSAWKNLLIFAVVAIGVFIALPNIFGEDPALQVSRDSGSVMTELEYSQISLALDEAKISYSRIYEQDGRAMILFGTVDDQLRASDLLHENLGKAYVIALTLAPLNRSMLVPAVAVNVKADRDPLLVIRVHALGQHDGPV
ncbi:MAG: hypothetical protein QGF92_04985, partial [Gammaproteobacteria bacterium]|nr:hypothetical protein [Gammaproteobacteria bacterium]